MIVKGSGYVNEGRKYKGRARLVYELITLASFGVGNNKG